VVLSGLENTVMVDLPKVVANPSTNRARRRLTLLIHAKPATHRNMWFACLSFMVGQWSARTVSQSSCCIFLIQTLLLLVCVFKQLNTLCLLASDMQIVGNSTSLTLGFQICCHGQCPKRNIFQLPLLQNLQINYNCLMVQRSFA